jgi:phosphocarrier protein FPr
VAVCGEAAADPEMIPLLVGLGVDELSVAPSSIGTVRAQVGALQRSSCERLATAALAAVTVAEVRRLVAAAAGGTEPPPG